MATSDGLVRRALRYLESARNLVGCAGGAVGVGLHYAGLGGDLWPGVVAGLYAVGALLAPGRRGDPSEGSSAPPGPASAGANPGPDPRSGSVSMPVSPPGPVSPPAPEPDPELEALAAYLDTVPLPPGVGVDGLLTALREAGPGPVAELIVRDRLPVAVAGYLRARTWQPWAGPDAADPAAELGREVGRLAAELA
ncbi:MULTISPECIES: hypothetical protein [Streptomyces]|uniref:hypothetical protein n=1 Tax=Streptomyces TaxID=1883 RepID=UPI000689B6AD|nr:MULTISPECIES: hypothetical protein [Streptomyces]